MYRTLNSNRAVSVEGEAKRGSENSIYKQYLHIFCLFIFPENGNKEMGHFFIVVIDGNDPQGGKHDDARERRMVRSGVYSWKTNENKYSGRPLGFW